MTARIATVPANDDYELTIDGLTARIFTLKSALGDCAAMMQADIDDGRATATPTRKYVIAKARELS